jgi:two-component system sensor histidine kinase MtrB
LWRRSYVRWRRSIQVRVVTTTLLLSTIVAVVLGVFLMQQITTALLESRSESAVQQLNEGLGILKRTQGDPAAAAERAARELAARSGPSGRYEVYLRNTTDETNGGLPTNDLDPESIPPQLTEEINREPGAKVWIGKLVRQYHEDEAALIAAAKNGPYELYYLFPLQQEQRTLVFVQRTMVGVGVSLVLLLAAIASVVTGRSSSRCGWPPSPPSGWPRASWTSA